jgi:NhaA family Na+:H+ antiporter
MNIAKILPTNITKHIDLDTLAAVAMIMAALLALLVSNSPLSDAYHHLITTPFTIGYANFSLTSSFANWVKDLLMAIFFLSIALELKKEFYEGFLTDKAQFILPLIATVGGIVFPALAYFLVNYNTPQYMAGFAIPCATDIAFSMCVFNLFAKKFSPAIKIFLLSIAIFDDLASMIIIALFYNHQLELIALLASGLIASALFILGYKKNQNFILYALLGSGLWIAFHKAGLHTTIAGVVIGACIPMYNSSNSGISPLKKLSSLIHPWVTFVILPIFAFVSSGVVFSHLKFSDLLHPISLGVILGLFLGKQFGIFLSTYLAVRLKLATLPERSNWFEVYVVACLAGIGFTMSLFISFLAFEENETLQDFAKISILFSSVITVIYSALVIQFNKIRR